MDGRLSRSQLKEILSKKKPAPTVDFSVLQGRHIAMFVSSLRKKKDGSEVSSSTHNTARSSINDLFRKYDVEMPKEMKTYLVPYFRGLKRTTAAKKGEGKQKLHTGRLPMEFSFYCYLAESLLKSGWSFVFFSISQN
jgi:hypothetical protein